MDSGWKISVIFLLKMQRLCHCQVKTWQCPSSWQLNSLFLCHVFRPSFVWTCLSLSLSLFPSIQWLHGMTTSVQVSSSHRQKQSVWYSDNSKGLLRLTHKVNFGASFFLSLSSYDQDNARWWSLEEEDPHDRLCSLRCLTILFRFCPSLKTTGAPFPSSAANAEQYYTLPLGAAATISYQQQGSQYFEQWKGDQRERQTNIQLDRKGGGIKVNYNHYKDNKNVRRNQEQQDQCRHWHQWHTAITLFASTRRSTFLLFHRLPSIGTFPQKHKNIHSHEEKKSYTMKWETR
jgi:hypothetical protein